MPARSAVIKASDLRSAPLLAALIKDFDGLPAEAWHAWLKDSPALRHFAIESRGVADLRASVPEEHTRKKDTRSTAARPYQRNGTTIASSSLTICSHSGSEATNRVWGTSVKPFLRAEGQCQPLTCMTYTYPSRAIEGATAITREPDSDSAEGCDHALPRGVRGQRTGRCRGRQAVPETTTGFGLHVPTRRATDAAANPSDKRAKRLNDRVACRAAM